MFYIIYNICICNYNLDKHLLKILDPLLVGKFKCIKGSMEKIGKLSIA